MFNPVLIGRLATVVSAFWLVACGQQAQRLDHMSELMMPAAAFAGVSHVEVYGSSDDLAGETGSEAVGDALRRMRLAGSAQYRYEAIDPTGTTFRVKVDLFDSEAQAEAAFRGRHLPEALAMTEPLALGDDGFIVEAIYAGVRTGRVAVEIRAVPPDSRLRAFTRAYATFLSGIEAGER
ncbi:MAG: hypothetical protein ABF271_06895 [Abyssibacter sp.]|jgi:hypothetical protein|uniref:hypothetical protein n=1 Tax=Abyssibacter sp. TaxID=2320200 RepID=UPI00321A02CB